MSKHHDQKRTRKQHEVDSDQVCSGVEPYREVQGQKWFGVDPFVRALADEGASALRAILLADPSKDRDGNVTILSEQLLQVAKGDLEPPLKTPKARPGVESPDILVF